MADSRHQMQMHTSTLARVIVPALSIAWPCLGFAADSVAPLDPMETYIKAHPQVVETIVHDYLMTHPEVIQDALKELLKKREANTIEKDKVSIAENTRAIFHNSDDVVIGNPDGDVTLVEFFDYNCHFCKQSMPDIKTLLETDPGLKIVLKAMPVLGPASIEAARVAESARRQAANTPAYAQFHQSLMTYQGIANQASATDLAVKAGFDRDMLERDYFSLAVTKTLEADLALSGKLSLTGTPGFVIGNSILRGAVGLKALRDRIALERKQNVKMP